MSLIKGNVLRFVPGRKSVGVPPIISPVMISLCGIAFGSLSSNIVTPPIPVPKYLGSSANTP